MLICHFYSFCSFHMGFINEDMLGLRLMTAEITGPDSIQYSTQILFLVGCQLQLFYMAGQIFLVSTQGWK